METVERLCETPGVWHKRLYNNSWFPAFLIGILSVSQRRPTIFISPADAKRHSNPCQEDFGAGIEFAEGVHWMDRRSVEFADIREKPSPRGPSLDQGTSAELDRSDRASAPIVQIIVPP